MLPLIVDVIGLSFRSVIRISFQTISNLSLVTLLGEELSYFEYKQRLEFDEHQYTAINQHCKLPWFASVWDKPSVDFMSNFCTHAKIPSARVSNVELCRYAREKFDFLILSTGMSFEAEIEAAMDAAQPDVVMHCVGEYPTKIEHANLLYIRHLADRWRSELGYSSHDEHDSLVHVAIGMGARWIEKHITLDRSSWGSDQSSSYEPHQLKSLVESIRMIERSLGQKVPREVFDYEVNKRLSLSE